MNGLAECLLLRLLQQGEANAAGVRKSPARLTSNDLKAYRDTASLSEKESFESLMQLARSRGAVCFEVDDRHDSYSFIKRVELADIAVLAEILGRPLQTVGIEAAAVLLAPWLHEHSVLAEVVDAWRQLKAPRKLGPESASDWLDGVKAINFLRQQTITAESGIPVRVASQTLFNDTKRLEQLVPALDALLVGSLGIPARQSAEVWQELGLLKEEQPALLAGKVVIARSRVTSVLDSPYSGFSPVTVHGLESSPSSVLSIENLTTFHMEARRCCNESILLLYTGGMPSPNWRSMYRRLLACLPESVPVYHWGDIDEGGFRIAAVLADDARAKGRELQPWDKMHPRTVPTALQVPAREQTIERMCRFAAQAGWDALCTPLRDGGFTVEQEALI